MDLTQSYREYRPRLHFSVPKGWANDPNGLIFDGEFYHLYYQFYPDGTHHGPMHWGHAKSRNLISWEHLPIALYPDAHGEIFSGSIVMDVNNSSGFGRDGKAPMVAVYTYHKEHQGKTTQSQGIAYSLDGGLTFRKYENNPVLETGMADFRDPKVIWHEPTQKWIMPLVGGRNVMFYVSGNLREWEYASTFDAPAEKPRGIWECPDLHLFETDEGLKWVLIVSINSYEDMDFGMQYFVGDFDGQTFRPETPADEVLMLDFGLDHYAAVTYNGIKDRTVLLGWMNCWHYAEQIPCEGFRGSMTFPRELMLKKTNHGYRIFQSPVRELTEALIREDAFSGGPCVIKCTVTGYEELLFTNGTDELRIVINPERGQVCVDRSRCGHAQLGDIFSEPRCGTNRGERLDEIMILLDVTSVEVFCAGGGLAGSVQYFIDTAFREIRCGRQDTRLEFFGVVSGNNKNAEKKKRRTPSAEAVYD